MSGMTETQCDGMPTMMGCGQSITNSVPYKLPGKKKSGWLVIWGINDDGTEDKEMLLTFCPRCAVIVEEQEAKRKAGL